MGELAIRGTLPTPLVDEEPTEAMRAIIARGLPEARGLPGEGRQEAAADDDGGHDGRTPPKALNADSGDIVFFEPLVLTTRVCFFHCFSNPLKMGPMERHKKLPRMTAHMKLPAMTTAQRFRSFVRTWVTVVLCLNGLF